MQVYGPAQLHGAHTISAPHSTRLSASSAPAQPGSIQDELEISDAARMIDEVREMPDIRQDRVDEIRAQIASGAYETDEKLEIALGRLLDELG